MTTTRQGVWMMSAWVELITAKVRSMYASSYRLHAFQWRGLPEWRLSNTCHIYRRRCLLRSGAPLKVKR